MSQADAGTARAAALLERLHRQVAEDTRTLEEQEDQLIACLLGAEWTPEEIARMARPKPASDRMAVGE